MKVTVTKQQIEQVLRDDATRAAAKIKVNDPWWVIALKVAAYLIGLLLGGVATTSCASLVGVI